MALLWAAGIIWFAYDFAGSQAQGTNSSDNAEQATDGSGAPVSSDDTKKLGQELNSF